MVELEEVIVAQQEVVEGDILRFETRVGEMTYDRASRVVCSPLVEEPVHLTPTEATIFEELMKHPHATVTYEKMSNLLWGVTHSKVERLLLETNVSRLRTKLGEEQGGRYNNGSTSFKLIHNIRNVGYSLADPRLGWEQFESEEVIVCNTSVGQFRFRLPEMTVLSPLLESEVQLMPVEWKIFMRLIGQSDQVVSYSILLKEGWNIDDVRPVDTHLVDMGMTRLRRKLGEQKTRGKYKLIHNYKKKGFSLGSA